MKSFEEQVVSGEGCLWQETAIPCPSFPPLEGESSVDVAVVGGGLTGIRTALGLAEAGVSATVIDAQHVAWGASGRSGGQCNPMWRATPEQLKKKLGPVIGERQIEATLASSDDLFADIERYNIDCDPVQGGWVQTAHCRSAEKDLLKLHEAWDKVGARIKVLDRQQVADETGSQEYNFGLLHETGGHVHPLSMTRGFALAAKERGVKIHDFTLATGIEQVAGKWKVSTPNGHILAERVVLATNAYTDNLLPGLKKTILPMVSIILATNPLSEDLQKQVLPSGVTLSDTRRAIYYARLDRDKRLVFGCIGSGDRVELLGGMARLKTGLHRVFPALEGQATPYSWSGRIAMTPSLMPQIFEPQPGIIAALGYTGRGIVNTSMMAKAVVKRLMGAEESELPFPISEFSSIPLHGLVKPFIPVVPPMLATLDWLDPK